MTKKLIVAPPTKDGVQNTEDDSDGLETTDKS